MSIVCQIDWPAKHTTRTPIGFGITERSKSPGPSVRGAWRFIRWDFHINSLIRVKEKIILTHFRVPCRMWLLMYCLSTLLGKVRLPSNYYKSLIFNSQLRNWITEVIQLLKRENFGLYVVSKEVFYCVRIKNIKI